MGTFFLVAALMIGAGWFAAMLGSPVGFFFLWLVAAAVIAAIINAWNKLSRRLERIEKALGIAEEPENQEPPEAPPEP